MTTSLNEDTRRHMKRLGAAPQPRVTPTPYDAALNDDAAAFDSAPGAGFNTDPTAAAIVPPEGHVNGAGRVLQLDPAQNNTFRALNRAWAQGAMVQFAAGRYLVSGLSESAQNDLVKSFALQASRANAAPDAVTVRKPRIGVFEPWASSMDEGWSRWVLEQYGFSFTTIHPEDFKTALANRIDVLILADDARVPVEGEGRGGSRAIRPEHAYQLTADDLQRFEKFVHDGGTLVCLSNASAFAIQHLKLPVRNAVAGLRPEEFFLRGSIVEVVTDQTHRVMAGMPDKAAVFVDSSPVFETEDGFRGTVIARYQESGSPLLSGYLIGEQRLNGKAAALDVRVGDGHVILLGFRPEWRGQPFGTFKVLFNAALFTGRAQ
jgi:hypothetical protein